MYVTAKGQPKLVHKRGFSLHYNAQTRLLGALHKGERGRERARERKRERERERENEREREKESKTKPHETRQQEVTALYEHSKLPSPPLLFPVS